MSSSKQLAVIPNLGLGDPLLGRKINLRCCNMINKTRRKSAIQGLSYFIHSNGWQMAGNHCWHGIVSASIMALLMVNVSLLVGSLLCSSLISQQLLDGMKFVQTFMVPRGWFLLWSSTNFWNPWSSLNGRIGRSPMIVECFATFVLYQKLQRTAYYSFHNIAIHCWKEVTVWV